MKKFRTILTAAALCMIFVMAAGCSISQATNIELISYPKTEFLQNEEINDLEFKIAVTIENAVRPITFSINDPNGVQIDNFRTDRVGSFTAYFTYRSFTYRFDYTVSTGEYTGFAGGSGEVDDPYLIANAEQFKNIVLEGNSSEYTYYELIADIDLSGLDVAADPAYKAKIDLGHFKYPTESAYSFNGSLNGNDHKLMNFKATTDLGIFGTIYKGDFSNIVIDGFNTVGYRVAAFGPGLYDEEGEATATFTDVTINANCRLGFGGYIFQAKGAKSVTFTDCTMNGNVYGDGNNVGGFMGDAQCPVTFTDCEMNGTVLGNDQVGNFVGWVNGSSKATDLLTFTEREGTQTNSLGSNANVTYLAGLSSNSGNVSINTVNAKKGTTITVEKNSDGHLSWAAVDGAAYYRVVFNGQLFHLVKKLGETTYNLHFCGGYNTPMEVSDQLLTPVYDGTVYTAFATNGGLNGVTAITDTNNRVGTAADNIRDFNALVAGLTDSYPAYVLGGAGVSSEIWLSRESSELSTSTSLLVARNSDIVVYVFAYDVDGIIIAGGTVSASIIDSYKPVIETQE